MSKLISNPLTKRRELKVKVSSKKINLLARVIAPYGMMRRVADEAGTTTGCVYDILNTRKATPDMERRIFEAIQKIKNS